MGTYGIKEIRGVYVCYINLDETMRKRSGKKKREIQTPLDAQLIGDYEAKLGYSVGLHKINEVGDDGDRGQLVHPAASYSSRSTDQTSTTTPRPICIVGAQVRVT